MRLEKYKDFEVDDFVLDVDFKESILQTEREEETLYTVLMDRFPEKRADLLEARKLVFRLDQQYQQQKPSARDKAAVYENIIRLNQKRQKASEKTFWRGKGWLAVAASLLLLIAGISWFLPSRTAKEDRRFSTTYSEVVDYLLPDGTTVSLNANSTLELLGDWKATGLREVRLIGEAYFKVAKKEVSEAKFIVHTEGPDIEVLGTQFNVNTQQGRTLIMLEEGKIQLNPKGGKELPKIMKERQLAEYQAEQETIISDIDPAKYRLWLKGYFSVDDLSFEEVITEIKRVYGVKIELKETTIGKKSLAKGALPIKNLKELILTFETLYDVTITQEDGTLYIR